MAGFNPNSWGGDNTSLDYELFMEGDTPISPPISLLGHALTSPSQELSDPLTVNKVQKKNGKIRKLTRTLRPAEQTSVSFTINYGDSLWTPALQRARNGTAQTTTFVAVRLCPDDRQYEHAYVWPDSQLNPPVRPNDLITIGDTTIAEWQSEMRTAEELITWGVGAFRQYDGAVPFYAVAFRTEECADDSGSTFNKAVVVGGQGGAGHTPLIQVTNDRFATMTTPSTAAAADASIGTSVFTEGDVILVGFADTIDTTAPTFGGTLMSGDGGVTFAVDSNLSGAVGIYAVAKFGDKYLAAGGKTAVANGAKLYQSDNGIDWTAITSTVLSTAKAATAIAVDDEGGAFYVACDGGIFLKGTSSAGSILLTAITLPTTTANMKSVTVLGPNHIAVAGVGGYYAESLDGGATWTKPVVPGTSAVLALAGDGLRTFVGIGTAISERSYLSKMAFAATTIENGLTVAGNITGLDTPEGEHNFALAVTDLGEIFLVHPHYPNA